MPEWVQSIFHIDFNAVRGRNWKMRGKIKISMCLLSKKRTEGHLQTAAVLFTLFWLLSFENIIFVAFAFKEISYCPQKKKKKKRKFQFLPKKIIVDQGIKWNVKHLNFMCGHLRGSINISLFYLSCSSITGLHLKFLNKFPQWLNKAMKTVILFGHSELKMALKIAGPF